MATHKYGRVFIWVVATLIGGSGAAMAQSAPSGVSKPSAVKQAHTLTLHLDAEQTKVDWTIGVTLHKVHGTLKTNGGELIADLKTGVAQGEVEIDTASLSTGDPKRDDHWKKDVLDSAQYPAVIFHPTSIPGLKEGDGEQTVQAQGTITLHGSDHPVDLTFHLQITGQQAIVSTHFTVPYVQWGLKNPSSGFSRYDKEIGVDIVGKGTLSGQTVPEAHAQPGDSM